MLTKNIHEFDNGKMNNENRKRKKKQKTRRKIVLKGKIWYVKVWEKGNYSKECGMLSAHLCAVAHSGM